MQRSLLCYTINTAKGSEGSKSKYGQIKEEIQMAKERITQSEIDGVQYRRAKLWQIILIACNAFNGMAVYTIIGMAPYAASIGYGIATVAVGGLLMFTRIFDAVTDPLLAFLYDRVNTRFGKIRPLMLLGWLIQTCGLLGLFIFFSSKGHGVPTFLIFYIIYVIGYTIVNMTAQTLGALITNDPKQRPTVGVWNTALNYMIPMALTIILNMKLLPKFGGTYNQQFLTVACLICVAMSLFGVIMVCIGVAEYDKPENFKGTSKVDERLKLKDMLNVLAHNKPLQSYIISAASDKIAQQAQSATIVSTLLLGILIGDMGLGTLVTVVGSFPSIIFAAKYAGKHGNKESIVTWTRICIFANIVAIAFLTIIDPKAIANKGILMYAFMLITLCCSGFAMCVTTANTGFMADIIDYELDRSGKYIPAVVSGTYSLIDKIVSSVSSVIVTACIALVGYTATVPQPGDPATTGVFWVTMFLRYGLAIVGWLITLLAMRGCKLNKAEMVEVQKRIAEKKKAALEEAEKSEV